MRTIRFEPRKPSVHTVRVADSWKSGVAGTSDRGAGDAFTDFIRYFELRRRRWVRHAVGREILPRAPRRGDRLSVVGGVLSGRRAFEARRALAGDLGERLNPSRPSL